jgi:hypothetical protein
VPGEWLAAEAGALGPRQTLATTLVLRASSITPHVEYWPWDFFCFFFSVISKLLNSILGTANTHQWQFALI